MSPFIVLSLCVFLQTQQQSARDAAADSMRAYAQQTDIRLARVETRAEDMRSQLELEKINADREIDTLLFLLKFGSVSMTIVLGAFGFIGYRNLKETIAIQVDHAVEAALSSTLSSVVEPRMQKTLGEWDRKFATLFTRLEGMEDETK